MSTRLQLSMLVHVSVRRPPTIRASQSSPSKCNYATLRPMVLSFVIGNRLAFPTETAGQRSSGTALSRIFLRCLCFTDRRSLH